MACPRCNGELEPRPIRDVRVWICTRCYGVLLEQPNLITVLRAVAAATLSAADLDTVPEPIPDPGVHLPCPACRRDMQPFRYLGHAAVIADRCAEDGLLWIDADELSTMSLLWAKTDRNLTRAGKHHRDRRQRELQRFLRFPAPTG